ncbi:MAG: DUF4234 domain-containing protein [Dehalococcoidia bacterium]
MAQGQEPHDGDRIFCYHCGNRMPRNVNFCPSCGTAHNPTGVPARPPALLGKAIGHIKYRNMFVQVLLFIITLTIYGIYWYYVTLEEMDIANGNTGESGCLWTILLFVPIANLFAEWHHSTVYSTFVNDKYPGIAIFILGLVFPPAVWFLVQSDLNRAARGSA